ncbi:MAG: carbohydrate porin [Planctomycetes bacterium]|nr:carbohydrate porin [Planctomycetota bacterium]
MDRSTASSRRAVARAAAHRVACGAPRRYRGSLGAFAWLACGGVAAGQGWLEQERLTGEWGGARTSLAEAGIAIEGGWTAELARVLDGGVRERTTFHNLLDVNVTFDLEALAGLPQVTLFLDAYSVNGRQLSNDVGDLQAVSNLDSAPVHQIAEVWYEQLFDDGEWRVKLGKIDANSEFSVVENSGELLHSSLAVSPTTGAPIYPDPATAICAFWSVSESWCLSAGCFDGAGQEGVRTGGRGPKTFFSAPDDLYWIAECCARWCCNDGRLPGRAAFGLSHHSGTFDRFDGGTDDGTETFYATFDQLFWREHGDDPEELQGIGAALLLGLADEKVSEVARHAALGVQWAGLVDGRDDDVLAFALSWADLSSEAGAGFGEGEEIALELAWKVQVTPWLVVRPDLQRVFQPGGDASLDDAWVGMVRVDVTL